MIKILKNRIDESLCPRITKGVELKVGWYVFTFNSHGRADNLEYQASYATAFGRAFEQQKDYGYVRDSNSGYIEIPQ